MDKIEKLKKLLKRLNAGEDPASVKQEAQEFLASVSPEELSRAEQQLVEAGLAPEDLRNLCSAHMEMLGDDLKKMKATLKPGHVIHTFMTEHEIILGFLDELEKVNKKIQALAKYDAKEKTFTDVLGLAENLLGAEPHHQREEEVLFPEVEKRGLTGPPRIMRMEHVELRARKHALQELAVQAGKLAIGEFKSRLDSTAKMLILSLRDHIFKEDNILYPASIEIIRDEKDWARMKAACDKIGYCSFTPKFA